MKRMCLMTVLIIIFLVIGCSRNINEPEKSQTNKNVVEKESAMVQPKGPFCQSCAMPMEKAEQLGTNADDSKNNEYCCYCFQKGNFTEPNITMKQMIDKCVGFSSQMGMSETQAREMFENVMPKLKRWKQ
ncbi:MAG: zinc ribbon domain-containing protein [Planctomycetota bacterium]